MSDFGHSTESAEALYRFMRIAHVQHVMNWMDPAIRSHHLPGVDASPRNRLTERHARALRDALASPAWQEMLEADDRARRGRGYDGHTDAVVAVDP